MSDTPSGAYVIDEDYAIVSFNDTITGLCPQLEVGEKCHRRLMGLDEPCPPCPVANHVFGPRTDDELHKLLEQIRDTGAKVLLDDFGSGYSSLGMVGSYPFDVVKTGKSFVDEIEDKTTVRAVIASTIEMCHRIDMKTVAEGVETRAARGRPLQPGRPDRPLGAVHPGVPPRRLHDGVRQRAHAHGLGPSRAALPGQTLLRVHARSRRPLRPLPDEPDGRRGGKDRRSGRRRPRVPAQGALCHLERQEGLHRVRQGRDRHRASGGACRFPPPVPHRGRGRACALQWHHERD